ncbi:hypothetical protein JTE90_014949 [Oedothorax gibbosus]|uniref:BTB domain-containing protein n=1 Tax=Oedothorax gibbosus TaxID=931172 RepID=A0AAV6UWW4_9ARAC|nr:hypothetical protein JTE90_014949 [Oedothorax gibbosus]
MVHRSCCCCVKANKGDASTKNESDQDCQGQISDEVINGEGDSVADPVKLLLEEFESQVTYDPLEIPKNSKIQGADTLIVVNGDEYWAHKNLLIEESTFFKETFADDRNRDSVIHFNSKFMIPRVFKALLTFLYTGLLDIPSRDIGYLLFASCHLGMEKLRQACTEALDLSDADNLKHAFNTYQVSCQLNKKKARSYTAKVLAANLESIMLTRDFLELNHEQVMEIFSEPILGARSESVLFLAALRWLAVDYAARERHAVALLRCVDFFSLSLGEVLACFRPPLLRGVVRIPEVRTRLLEAACYVSAKAIHREYYGPKRRVLLLEDKPMILWNNTEQQRADETEQPTQAKQPSVARREPEAAPRRTNLMLLLLPRRYRRRS